MHVKRTVRLRSLEAWGRRVRQGSGSGTLGPGIGLRMNSLYFRSKMLERINPINYLFRGVLVFFLFLSSTSFRTKTRYGNQKTTRVS